MFFTLKINSCRYCPDPLKQVSESDPAGKKSTDPNSSGSSSLYGGTTKIEKGKNIHMQDPHSRTHAAAQMFYR